MERIREAVEIQAAPADVFALVSDLCRRARLNPAWRVIACEALDGGPIRAGSRWRFVVRRDRTRIEHVSRVIDYDPPRRIVCKSEIHSDLEIVLDVVPSSAGCRLTHEEAFRALSVPDEVRKGEAESFVRRFLRALLWLEGGGFQTADIQETHEALREQIRAEIRAWLAKIKEEAEGPGRLGKGES
ncbi:MAG: hypothetical protein A2V83_00670 [Nitrospirae bacterium RBG_16_64_22]|nr:MAG: hypothetical protein A2V83_00670 [Nitrospirae bacterium RBG_16_64_22]